MRNNKLHSSKSLLIGLIIIGFFGVITLLAPVLSPFNPYQTGYTNSDYPPMWVHNPGRSGTPVHPLGTDRLGRDILSRYLFGVRTSFILVLGAIPLAAIFGSVIGLISGFFGEKVDAVITLFMDIIQSLPGIMFMLIIILILRNQFEPSWSSGILTLIIGFASVAWVSLARMVRVSVLQLRSQLFIEAAVSIGVTRWRMITRHLLPNVSHIILIWVVNNVPAVILLEAILGYIGVAVTSGFPENDFTVTSWGGLFFIGRSTLNSNPMILLVPAASLLLLSMSFVLIADYFTHKYNRS
jgi:ABC-type dipeptide/oligopeptide/nickel transport system permease subunit